MTLGALFGPAKPRPSHWGHWAIVLVMGAIYGIFGCTLVWKAATDGFDAPSTSLSRASFGTFGVVLVVVSTGLVLARPWARNAAITIHVGILVTALGAAAMRALDVQGIADSLGGLTRALGAVASLPIWWSDVVKSWFAPLDRRT